MRAAKEERQELLTIAFDKLASGEITQADYDKVMHLDARYLGWTGTDEEKEAMKAGRNDYKVNKARTAAGNVGKHYEEQADIYISKPAQQVYGLEIFGIFKAVKIILGVK